MDRPQYDLRGIGLHRDQIDLLSLARPKRRIRMDASLIRTGLVFAAALTLAVLLRVALTALTE